MVDLRSGPSGPLASVVLSIFGRAGTVIAQAGDYDSDQVDNNSLVAGVSVTDALNHLLVGVGPDQDQIIYVGKHGNDANDGRKIELAKLTIGAAIIAATAFVPSPTNQITILIVDSGEYTENFNLPRWVNLVAPAARLVTSSALGGDQLVIAGEVLTAVGTAFSSNNFSVRVHLGRLVAAGAARGFLQSVGNSQLRVDYLETEDGAAIHSGGGNLDLAIGELSIVGTGVGVEFSAAPGSHVTGDIGLLHGTGTGLENAGAGTLALQVGSLECTNRWNLTSGLSRLIIGELGAGVEVASVGLQLTVAGEMRETSGPTDLVVGAVADGQYLRRVGATLVGATPPMAVTENQIIYVGKHGNDANNGRNIENAKLTIGSAIVAVNAAVPGVANPYTIMVLDGGVYAQNFVVPTYTTLLAPAATLNATNGFIDLNAHSSIVANRINLNGAAASASIRMLGDAANLRAQRVTHTGFDVMIQSSVGAGEEAVICIDSVETNFAAVEQITLGRTIVRFGEVQITGSGRALSLNGAGQIVADIGSIADAGAGGAFDALQGSIWVHAGRIAANTRWNVQAGAFLYVDAEQAAVGGETLLGTLRLNLAGQIRETGVGVDLVVGAITDGQYLRRVGTTLVGTEVVFQRFEFFSDQLDAPVNADWAVNSPAPRIQDTNNAGLTVAAFDDAVAEGVGFIVHIPTGAANMRLRFVSRAETAPPAARTVGLMLYERGMPDNAAVDAWSGGTQLTDIGIPTNENFQYDTQVGTLLAWGLVAGSTHQFELTRVAPTAGTNLAGDWDLLAIIVEFT